MPQLADPSDIWSRPDSVALGELAIAAGLVGESVTIAYDFPANTLCQVWKYHTRVLGAGDVLHVRTKKDIKELEQRISAIRAVFVYSPRWYHNVAWSIQMAGSRMSLFRRLRDAMKSNRLAKQIDGMCSCDDGCRLPGLNGECQQTNTPSDGFFGTPNALLRHSR